jgi:hypothetical protein
MVLSYAPFGDDVKGEFRPQPYVPPPAFPKGSVQNTECNYVAMAFVIGVIVMGIMDSLRK